MEETWGGRGKGSKQLKFLARGHATVDGEWMKRANVEHVTRLYLGGATYPE